MRWPILSIITFSIFFCYSICYPQIPPCDDLGISPIESTPALACQCPHYLTTTVSPNSLDRCKREIGTFKYPHPGIWYQVKEDRKFYYLLGNTVFVERSDGFYSKWVTSGKGFEWSLNDNYVWRWDENGRWYPFKSEDGSTACTKPQMPLKCIGDGCSNHIRFPSNGLWYTEGGIVSFQEENGGPKYELQENKLYKKIMGQGSKGDCAGCYWTWNFETGVWKQTKDKGKVPAKLGDPWKPIEDNRLPYNLEPRSGKQTGIIGAPVPPSKISGYWNGMK